MQYLGIDVHSQASVWCLVDSNGEIRARGRVETKVAALGELVEKLARRDALRVGQEVGTMAYLVHDAVSGAGAEILSFNAAQLRMISASRKKTDRRDAYWIARALQTGLHPHPVYLPMGEIRELRALLTRRRMIQRDRNRWQYRARAALRASGYKVRTGGHYLRRALDQLLASELGIDAHLLDLLELCQRQESSLGLELRRAEAELRQRARSIEAISRLQTLPGIGALTATTIYAWVGDVRRFPNAKALARGVDARSRRSRWRGTCCASRTTSCAMELRTRRGACSRPMHLSIASPESESP
jgi:transposase